MTLQNTSVRKWAVINIANVSINTIGNFRELRGALVESTGKLDAPLTSLINNYYPALTVNSASIAGKAFIQHTLVPNNAGRLVFGFH